MHHNSIKMTVQSMRSRLSFSLRTVFLVITAFAICLAAAVSWGRIGIAASVGTTGILMIVVGIGRDKPTLFTLGLVVATLGTTVPAMRGSRWVGRSTVIVSFSVVDQMNGEPIRKASIKLRDALTSSVRATGLTDVDGRVDIPITVAAAGADDFFQGRSFVDVSDIGIEIDAEGYLPFRESMRHYVDAEWEVPRRTFPEIVIGLDRDCRVQEQTVH
jgi:hypothetical protein